MALAAYRNAERMMATADPGCGVSWNLLAGIGRIESMHANGGATDPRGTAVNPIYGPALDGTLPGNEVIVQSIRRQPRHLCPGDRPDAVPAGHLGALRLRRRRRRHGRPAERVRRHPGRRPLPVQRRPEPARPVAGHGRDPALQQLDALRPERAGLGGGVRRPASSRSTCRRSSGRRRRSATRTWSSPEGLGPGLPLNVNGLPANDPLAQMPLIDFGTPSSRQLQHTRGRCRCRPVRRPAAHGAPPSSARLHADLHSADAPVPHGPGGPAPPTAHRHPPPAATRPPPPARRRRIRCPRRRRRPHRPTRPGRPAPRARPPGCHAVPTGRPGPALPPPPSRPAPARRADSGQLTAPPRLGGDVRTTRERDPRRTGQGDRPRTAPPHHRTRHGQEHRRRRRRRGARRDLPDHVRLPEEDRDQRAGGPGRRRRARAPARSTSSST